MNSHEELVRRTDGGQPTEAAALRGATACCLLFRWRHTHCALRTRCQLERHVSSDDTALVSGNIDHHDPATDGEGSGGREAVDYSAGSGYAVGRGRRWSTVRRT